MPFSHNITKRHCDYESVYNIPHSTGYVCYTMLITFQSLSAVTDTLPIIITQVQD